jgi:hypothetical protein
MAARAYDERHMRISKILGVLIVAGVTAIVIVNLPAIRRYIHISTM